MIRESELLNLRWPNIDFERRLISRPNFKKERTKSKRGGIVLMNKVAYDILWNLYQQRGDGEYVFVNPKTGKPYTDVKKGFAKACRLAKIEDFHSHDLRRTGATRLGAAGVSAHYISAVLDHADVETSKIYTVATDEGLRRAMESLTERPIKQNQAASA